MEGCGHARVTQRRRAAGCILPRVLDRFWNGYGIQACADVLGRAYGKPSHLVASGITRPEVVIKSRIAYGDLCNTAEGAMKVVASGNGSELLSCGDQRCAACTCHACSHALGLGHCTGALMARGNIAVRRGAGLHTRGRRCVSVSRILGPVLDPRLRPQCNTGFLGLWLDMGFGGRGQRCGVSGGEE